MTTATLAGLVLIGGFVLLLLLRVPISFAMLLSTLGSAMVTGTNFSVLVRQMVDGANNFSLLSIPFFIVMGEFMSAGGISEKIVDLANLAVGRFRGGLAYVNVLDSMFFGGISGSAVADVSSLGTIVIPMMVKQGYDEDFSVGLTVTTACQGVLIPPTHNMVIYALAAGGVSIGTLFMAGLLPGIALGCGMIIMCMLMAKRYNFPKGEGVAKGESIKILLRGILPMMTLLIIMVDGGIGHCVRLYDVPVDGGFPFGETARRGADSQKQPQDAGDRHDAAGDGEGVCLHDDRTAHSGGDFQRPAEHYG